MRSAGNFHPEWGYLAPAPGFMRTARIALVATAIGATAGAAAVVALVDHSSGDTANGSLASHALVVSAAPASEPSAPVVPSSSATAHRPPASEPVAQNVEPPRTVPERGPNVAAALSGAEKGAASRNRASVAIPAASQPPAATHEVVTPPAAATNEPVTPPPSAHVAAVTPLAGEAIVTAAPTEPVTAAEDPSSKKGAKKKHQVARGKPSRHTAANVDPKRRWQQPYDRGFGSPLFLGFFGSRGGPRYY